MSDDTTHHHDEDLTTSTMERWEYIGTILAGAMVLSLPVIVVGAGLGILSLSPIGQAWFLLYSTVTLMAATWAFGKETLEAVRKARGKDTDTE
jgi:hypothetical protein